MDMIFLTLMVKVRGAPASIMNFYHTEVARSQAQ